MRLFLFLAALLLHGAAAVAATPSEALRDAFSGLPPHTAPSGVLYDRVLPLSALGELDGRADAPPITTARWRQAYHEMRRGSADPRGLPPVDSLRPTREPAIRIGILDFRYDRIRDDAFTRGQATLVGGRLQLGGDALEEGRVFAAAPLRDTAHRSTVEFSFRATDHHSNHAEFPPSLEFDAGDGRGLREVRAGESVRVRYPSRGAKAIRVRATWPDGTEMWSASRLFVEALATPAPDDTLRITASVPHEGTAATGEAYLYYAPGHSSLVRPVVLVEGFDLDDSMNWDEIYALLNEENLLEDIRAAGYDIVALNFDDATTDIQRNSYLVVELLQQVQQRIGPTTRIALAGASMGGLCSRYALSWMEQNDIPHRVNTFISFDAPQRGANIPLGLQFWLGFFSGESADADFLLSRLDRPAARQLLVYHHESSPSSTAQADPLRGAFLSDLAVLGDYPSQPRLVAIANGSSTGQDQGFAAGDQIIEWEYDSFLVDVRGNVWALPDGTSGQIFQGMINIILLPSESENVSVSGTDPFDGAPGGSRASMAQADSTAAPYGDIVALHASHCFIPTISALDLATEDLFFDVAAAPDPASMSPFDAVYFPTANQGHVAITAENAAWIKAELFASPTAAPPQAPVSARIRPATPNPFNPRTTIELEIFETGPARLEVFDTRGRRVATLVDAVLPAGIRKVVWDGTDATGSAVASGVYFARLSGRALRQTESMVLIR